MLIGKFSNIVRYQMTAVWQNIIIFGKYVKNILISIALDNSCVVLYLWKQDDSIRISIEKIHYANKIYRRTG